MGQIVLEVLQDALDNRVVDRNVSRSWLRWNNRLFLKNHVDNLFPIKLPVSLRVLIAKESFLDFLNVQASDG